MVKMFIETKLQQIRREVKMKNFIQKGFTLAEVLITLAILGVVAAVTLPNMVQDTKYQQLGVKLSKFVSNLENAATAYAVGLGGEFGNYDELIEFFNNSFIANGGMTTGVSISDVSNGSTDPAMKLKDGSLLKYAIIPNGYGSSHTQEGVGNGQLMGERFAVVYFFPQIKGLKGQRDFGFIITKKGYVVPTNMDSCMTAIYNAKYKVSPSLFTASNGSCKQE